MPARTSRVSRSKVRSVNRRVFTNTHCALPKRSPFRKKPMPLRLEPCLPCLLSPHPPARVSRRIPASASSASWRTGADRVEPDTELVRIHHGNRDRRRRRSLAPAAVPRPSHRSDRRVGDRRCSARCAHSSHGSALDPVPARRQEPPLHPVISHFYGAPPMAFLTVGAGTLLLGKDWIGLPAAVAVDWVLWVIGTVGGSSPRRWCRIWHSLDTRTSPTPRSAGG